MKSLVRLIRTLRVFFGHGNDPAMNALAEHWSWENQVCHPREALRGAGTATVFALLCAGVDAVLFFLVDTLHEMRGAEEIFVVASFIFAALLFCGLFYATRALRGLNTLCKFGNDFACLLEVCKISKSEIGQVKFFQLRDMASRILSSSASQLTTESWTMSAEVGRFIHLFLMFGLVQKREPSVFYS